MSEYSESYHLRDASQNDAAQLLQRAGLKGVIFPTTAYWTSFVPYGRDWEGLAAIVQANQGLLLHYSYGEDCGWVIEVYQGSEKQMHFEHWWDASFDEACEDAGVEIPARPSNNIELALLAQWLQNDSNRIDELQSCFEVDGEDRAYRFAELIGLQYFEWMSPSYISHNPTRIAGAIEV